MTPPAGCAELASERPSLGSGPALWSMVKQTQRQIFSRPAAAACTGLVHFQIHADAAPLSPSSSTTVLLPPAGPIERWSLARSSPSVHLRAAVRIAAARPRMCRPARWVTVCLCWHSSILTAPRASSPCNELPRVLRSPASPHAHAQYGRPPPPQRLRQVPVADGRPLAAHESTRSECT